MREEQVASQHWYSKPLGILNVSRRLGQPGPARDLLVLALLSATLLVAWSFAVPIFEAPDEFGHWQYAHYIHETMRLPEYNSRFVEGNQSPLYYLLIAPVATSTEYPPPISQASSDSTSNPPFKISQISNSDFGKYWPIRIARLVTAFISVFTVIFAYLTGFGATGNRVTGLLTGGLVAFLPQFTFRGMNVSNDALVTMVSAATVYLIVRLIKRGFTWSGSLAAAVAMACAYLAKADAGLLSLTFSLSIISEPAPWKTRIRHLAILGVALILVAPWLVRNYLLYGDLFAAKAMFTAVSNLMDIKPITSPYFVTAFPNALFRSFIGTFGHMSLWLPEYTYYFYFLLGMLAVLGLGWCGIQYRLDYRLVLILLTVVLLNLVFVVYLNLIFTQPQGRYLFPALSSIALLVAIGLECFPGWSNPLTLLLLCLLLLLNVSILTLVILPTYWNFPL